MAYRKASGSSTLLPHYTAQRIAVSAPTAVKSDVTTLPNEQVPYTKTATVNPPLLVNTFHGARKFISVRYQLFKDEAQTALFKDPVRTAQ